MYANQPTASLTGVEMRGDVIIKATSTAKRTVTVDIDNVKKDGTVAYQFYQGVINGMDGKLNPQGEASRVQVATMFMRFSALLDA